MRTEVQTGLTGNPLLVIARNWYGCSLTENRTRKLDALWRKFMAACAPKQEDLFR